MQIGDKIVLKTKLHIPNDSVYTIIEINGDWAKVKHPIIGGHFTVRLEKFRQI